MELCGGVGEKTSLFLRQGAEIPEGLFSETDLLPQNPSLLLQIAGLRFPLLSQVVDISYRLFRSPEGISALDLLPQHLELLVLQLSLLALVLEQFGILCSQIVDLGLERRYRPAQVVGALLPRFQLLQLLVRCALLKVVVLRYPIVAILLSSPS